MRAETRRTRKNQHCKVLREDPQWRQNIKCKGPEVTGRQTGSVTRKEAGVRWGAEQEQEGREVRVTGTSQLTGALSP